MSFGALDERVVLSRTIGLKCVNQGSGFHTFETRGWNQQNWWQSGRTRKDATMMMTQKREKQQPLIKVEKRALTRPVTCWEMYWPHGDAIHRKKKYSYASTGGVVRRKKTWASPKLFRCLAYVAIGSVLRLRTQSLRALFSWSLRPRFLITSFRTRTHLIPLIFKSQTNDWLPTNALTYSTPTCFNWNVILNISCPDGPCNLLELVLDHWKSVEGWKTTKESFRNAPVQFKMTS